MSHNGTIFPPQSVRRLGQKIIKWEDILYIYFTKCAKKIDQYSIKSCCLQMPIWREEEVREVSSHVTCHATLVSFQPKERSCAEAEAKKEVHSLLSLGGINAQKVGHLASEIGVGIPKKSNEIFCGSSKRLGSGAGKMLLLRLKPFFFCFSLPYHYLVVAKVVSLSGLLLSRGFSELRSSSQLLPRHI